MEQSVESVGPSGQAMEELYKCTRCAVIVPHMFSGSLEEDADPHLGQVVTGEGGWKGRLVSG